MLEDEKNAVNKFIKDKRIQIISQDEFEKNDTVTDLIRNEYVALSDGVYMQIVDRGSAENKRILSLTTMKSASVISKKI